MHELVKLAKETIKLYVTKGEKLSPPEELTPEMAGRAGVFVSIHKAHALRGCIGTFAPTQGNIALEIIENAISASTRDPRFPPVRKEELDLLEINVDILSSPVPADYTELDAKKFGVIVKSGYKRGLLLPDLPGVNTPDEQIEICRMKAGIGEKEPVELFKFEVKRYR